MQSRDRSPVPGADQLQTGFNPLARLRFKLSELVIAKTAAPARSGAKELNVLAVREEQTVVVEPAEDVTDNAVVALRGAADALRSRRVVLGGLATLPALVSDVAPETALPPCGIKAAPASPNVFDPISYIAEMRASGVVLTPNFRDGTFSIGGKDGEGIPHEMMDVTQRWDKAAVADPNWIGRVFRILAAEGNPSAQTNTAVADLWHRATAARAAMHMASAAYHAAEDQLPWWVKPGSSIVNSYGEFVGSESFEPAVQNYTLPEEGSSVCTSIRPTEAEFRRRFEHERLFWGEAKAKEVFCQRMAKLNERRAAAGEERQKLGIPAFAKASDATSEVACACDSAIRDLPVTSVPTPTFASLA